MSIPEDGDQAMPVVAGVELGGTKAIAIVGRGQSIFDSVTVPTTTPAATLGAMAAQLTSWADRWHPRALGIASFGPIALRADCPDYGHMLATPKAGWAGADVVGWLAAAVAGPCALHTDVTAAALAEGEWGAAQGLSDYVYVTIGTGIGMGIIVNGAPVVGRLHPEAGHVRVRRLAGDAFQGVCPFHGDCLEGLASGPAIAARGGANPSALSPDDPAWAYVADAIAESFAGLILTLAPQAIVMGGGVGVGQGHLLPRIRALVGEKLADYLPSLDAPALDGLIVPAGLDHKAGPLGALLVAQKALEGC